VPTDWIPPVGSPLERDFRLFADEPVLPLGPSGSWDSGLMDPGAVVFHDGKFHMFFNAVPYFPAPISAGHAESSDGLSWSRTSADPVFRVEDVNWKSKIGTLRVNSVLVDGETWVMYFSASYSISLLTGMVGRATASSPAGPWAVDPEPVLQAGGAGAWDSGAVGNVEVLRSEEGYVMYYCAAGKIGLATSKDGIRWTKFDDPSTKDEAFAESDPVFVRPSADDPNVVRTEWGWAMAFLSTAGLGYAVSPDGVHWEETPGNPIVSLPDKQIYYSSLVLHGESAYLYFEAGGGRQTNPYLATWSETASA
jgi:hypothetical protein